MAVRTVWLDERGRAGVFATRTAVVFLLLPTLIALFDNIGRLLPAHMMLAMWLLLPLFGLGLTWVSRARVELEGPHMSIVGLLRTRHFHRSELRALRYAPYPVASFDRLLWGQRPLGLLLDTTRGLVQLPPRPEIAQAVLAHFPDLPHTLDGLAPHDPLAERAQVAWWLDNIFLVPSLWFLLMLTSPVAAPLAERLGIALAVLAGGWLVYDVLLAIPLRGTLGTRLCGLIDHDAKVRPLRHAWGRLRPRLPGPHRFRRTAGLSPAPSAPIAAVSARALAGASLGDVLGFIFFALVFTNAMMVGVATTRTRVPWRPPEAFAPVPVDTASVGVGRSALRVPAAWIAGDACHIRRSGHTRCDSPGIQLAIFEPTTHEWMKIYGGGGAFVQRFTAWRPDTYGLHQNILGEGIRALAMGVIVGDLAGPLRHWAFLRTPHVGLIAYDKTSPRDRRDGWLDVQVTLWQGDQLTEANLRCRRDEDILALLSSFAVE